MSDLPQVQIVGDDSSNSKTTTNFTTKTTDTKADDEITKLSQTTSTTQQDQQVQQVQPQQQQIQTAQPLQQTPPQSNSWNDWGTAPAATPPMGGNSWGSGFDDYWGGVSGGGWGSPVGGVGAPGSTAPKKLTPEERVQMIEKVYQEVLNRKPDTRDINYYKYSTLSEEEVSKQLVQGKEHKDLLEHGKEYSPLKTRVEDAESKVKQLEGQIRDQLEEFKKLTDLLKEKNRYIEQLRVDLKNPLNLPNHALLAISRQEEANSTQHFSQSKSDLLPGNKSTSSKKESKVTIIDRIVNAFGG